LTGEDYDNFGAPNSIRCGGDGVRDRLESERIEDHSNGNAASIKREFAGEGGGESEESGAMDYGGVEIEVEGESDMRGERMRGIGERVWINGCHC
jgi:hypothetical protein